MSIVLSIVSHRQASMVKNLLLDVEKYCFEHALEVVVTINVEETIPFAEKDFKFHLTIIRNAIPKGFGANHNAAFKILSGDHFCVLNPDIRFKNDPFRQLLWTARSEEFGIIAPLVVNSSDGIEDSARRLPTPARILRKIFRSAPELDYSIGNTLLFPDWVAGMFMLFPSAVFRTMNGFDERYFLYYEDADICCRVRLAGWLVVLDATVRVVHDARRESHKNLKFLWWHLTSMARFFSSRAFFLCLLGIGPKAKQ